jgi:hypothetical protein
LLPAMASGRPDVRHCLKATTARSPSARPPSPLRAARPRCRLDRPPGP